MLAATLFKEFKRIFAGRRQDTALASEFNRLPVELEGGAAPGWWTGSCFRSRPRSFNTSAGQDPRRVWFFVSAARASCSRVIVQYGYACGTDCAYRF